MSRVFVTTNRRRYGSIFSKFDRRQTVLKIRLLGPSSTVWSGHKSDRNRPKNTPRTNQNPRRRDGRTTRLEWPATRFSIRSHAGLLRSLVVIVDRQSLRIDWESVCSCFKSRNENRWALNTRIVECEKYNVLIMTCRASRARCVWKSRRDFLRPPDGDTLKTRGGRRVRPSTRVPRRFVRFFSKRRQKKITRRGDPARWRGRERYYETYDKW